MSCVSNLHIEQCSIIWFLNFEKCKSKETHDWLQNFYGEETIKSFQNIWKWCHVFAVGRSELARQFSNRDIKDVPTSTLKEKHDDLVRKNMKITKMI